MNIFKLFQQGKTKRVPDTVFQPPVSRSFWLSLSAEQRDAFPSTAKLKFSNDYDHAAFLVDDVAKLNREEAWQILCRASIFGSAEAKSYANEKLARIPSGESSRCVWPSDEKIESLPLLRSPDTTGPRPREYSHELLQAFTGAPSRMPILKRTQLVLSQ